MNRHLISGALVLLVGACSATLGMAADVAEKRDAKLRSSAATVNQFGNDLYRAVSAGNDNVFYSPYSIHIALAMTLAGAGGQTAEQIQEVIHTQSAAAAATGFQSLAEHLKKVRDENDFELNIANSMWAEESMSFRNEFTSIAKDRFGSGLFRVDFRKGADAARSKINTWVSEQTKEKIPDLIPSGMLNRDTSLVLVNAIYFKAQWQHQFKKDATLDGDFRLADGSTTPARMMHQTLRVRYGEEEGVQILEMPYKGGATSMLILLPKGDGIATAEEMLTGDKLQASIEKLTEQQVDLTLPTYKIRFKIELTDQLSAMGMPLAFSDRADFSGITEEERLAISNVIHEAFVAVDEEGTEAAAATAVGFTRTSIMLPEESVMFKADHPFVFAIRDNASGAILFAGRLMKPEKESK